MIGTPWTLVQMMLRVRPEPDARQHVTRHVRCCDEIAQGRQQPGCGQLVPIQPQDPVPAALGEHERVRAFQRMDVGDDQHPVGGLTRLLGDLGRGVLVHREQDLVDMRAHELEHGTGPRTLLVDAHPRGYRGAPAAPAPPHAATLPASGDRYAATLPRSSP